MSKLENLVTQAAKEEEMDVSRFMVQLEEMAKKQILEEMGDPVELIKTMAKLWRIWMNSWRVATRDQEIGRAHV